MKIHFQIYSAVTLLMVMLFSSCIPSVFPLYTAKDLIDLPEIVGTWAKPDSSESWTFKVKTDKEYTLTHFVDGHEAIFDAHVINLKGFLFLDLYPENTASENYLLNLTTYPVHTFSKIKITENQLTLDMFDEKWFSKAIEKNEIDIDHIISAEGVLLLTASTNQLQEFVSKFSDCEECFTDPIVLSKQ